MLAAEPRKRPRALFKTLFAGNSTLAEGSRKMPAPLFDVALLAVIVTSVEERTSMPCGLFEALLALIVMFVEEARKMPASWLFEALLAVIRTLVEERRRIPTLFGERVAFSTAPLATTDKEMPS